MITINNLTFNRKEKVYLSFFVVITIVLGILLSQNNNGYLNLFHTFSFSLSSSLIGFTFYAVIKLTGDD